MIDNVSYVGFLYLVCSQICKVTGFNGQIRNFYRFSTHFFTSYVLKCAEERSLYVEHTYG